MAKSSVKVRAAYDDDYKSDDHGLVCVSPSVTKQSFKDECDINNVVARWQKSGQLVGGFNSSAGSFMDVSEVPDYQTSLNIVLDAQNRFMAMPSAVRDRFANDPAKLMAFLSDEANREEAIKLGLVAAPVVDNSVASKPSTELPTTAPEGATAVGGNGSP